MKAWKNDVDQTALEQSSVSLQASSVSLQSSEKQHLRQAEMVFWGFSCHILLVRPVKLDNNFQLNSCAKLLAVAGSVLNLGTSDWFLARVRGGFIFLHCYIRWSRWTQVQKKVESLQAKVQETGERNISNDEIRRPLQVKMLGKRRWWVEESGSGFLWVNWLSVMVLMKIGAPDQFIIIWWLVEDWTQHLSLRWADPPASCHGPSVWSIIHLHHCCFYIWRTTFLRPSCCVKF